MSAATVPSAAMAPREITSRRSQVASTSCMTWVLKITVRSLPKELTSLRISTRWLGSSPSVGSSSTRISGE